MAKDKAITWAGLTVICGAGLTLMSGSAAHPVFWIASFVVFALFWAPVAFAGNNADDSESGDSESGDSESGDSESDDSGARYSDHCVAIPFSAIPGYRS